VVASAGACSSHASRSFTFAGFGEAAVFPDTSITYRITTNGAEDRMFGAPGDPATISAGQGYGAAFNRVLAGGIAFGDDGHFAAKLLGWHGVELYLLGTALASSVGNQDHRAASQEMG